MGKLPHLKTPASGRVFQHPQGLSLAISEREESRIDTLGDTTGALKERLSDEKRLGEMVGLGRVELPTSSLGNRCPGSQEFERQDR